MNEIKIFESSEMGELRILEKRLVSTYLGVVYALEYGDKLKIGHSTRPYTRIMALKRNGEKYGKVSIWRVCISTPHTNHFEIERVLHEKFLDYRVGNTELFDIGFDEFIRCFENTTLNMRDDTEKIDAKANSFLSNIKSFILGGFNV